MTYGCLQDKWKTLVQTSRIPPQQKRRSIRQSFGCPCLLISASSKTTQEVPSWAWNLEGYKSLSWMTGCWGCPITYDLVEKTYAIDTKRRGLDTKGNRGQGEGTPWPRNNTKDHPRNRGGLDTKGNLLPYTFYVYREKRPDNGQ